MTVNTPVQQSRCHHHLNLSTNLTYHLIIIYRLAWADLLLQVSLVSLLINNFLDIFILGFNPYFMPHPHSQGSSGLQMMSSLRYSSPPPLLPHTISGESMLGSPLPRPHYDGLYPPLEPGNNCFDFQQSKIRILLLPGQSLSSMSPTPGLYHQSPSPCLDMFSAKSRGIMSHHHQTPAYHPQLGFSSNQPALLGHRYVK